MNYRENYPNEDQKSIKTKTEEYTIKRVNCNNLWKDCKLLGSSLEIQNDFKRRKGLAINAANKLKHLFLKKDITINVKTVQIKFYSNRNFTNIFI